MYRALAVWYILYFCACANVLPHVLPVYFIVLFDSCTIVFIVQLYFNVSEQRGGIDNPEKKNPDPAQPKNPKAEPAIFWVRGSALHCGVVGKSFIRAILTVKNYSIFFGPDVC